MYQPRTLLLITVAIATAVVLGKSSLNPVTQIPEVTDYVFPETVPLPQWTLVSRGPVNPNLVQSPAYIDGYFISGKAYQYHLDSCTLTREK